MRKDNLSNELATKLRTQILRGTWPVGTALPSTRQLAREHNVSPNTIHGVLRELAAQGLVDLRPRRGRFVRASTPSRGPEPLPAVQIAVIRPVEIGTGKEEHNRWSSNIISAMEDVFVTEGLRLTLLGYPVRNTDWPRWVIEQVESRRAEFAGLVCFANAGVDRVIAHFRSRDLPWVTINRPDEYRMDNFVMAHNGDAGRLVGRIFTELGFERVAYLGSRTPIHGSSFEKLTGMVQSFLARGRSLAGICVADCPPSQIDDAAGYEAMRDLLRKTRGAPPQAVFCSGDLLAIGAMRACREAGLAIPDDISIVGSTGTEVGAYTQPTLTTVAQPMTEMGRRAGLMLLRMVSERTHQLPGERIPCKLILRSSLRRLPEGLQQQVSE
jgi:DNA-binding LacI/PurR family transcriptional regulator